MLANLGWWASTIGSLLHDVHTIQQKTGSQTPVTVLRIISYWDMVCCTRTHSSVYASHITRMICMIERSTNIGRRLWRRRQECRAAGRAALTLLNTVNYCCPLLVRSGLWFTANTRYSHILRSIREVCLPSPPINSTRAAVYCCLLVPGTYLGLNKVSTLLSTAVSYY